MSRHEYLAAGELTGQDLPFYALIMAAMRQADTPNLERLKVAFPWVWAELSARYHAPDGVLVTDL